jgi:hypothetical protein
MKIHATRIRFTHSIGSIPLRAATLLTAGLIFS